MNTIYNSIEELSKLFPDEWVLLGNPEMKNTSVLGGIVLYHSKDKKEVCYMGRDKTSEYTTVTITFLGELKRNRKIGILKKL
jgi:hypothetical protein